jgi:hypothetical protein
MSGMSKKSEEDIKEVEDVKMDVDDITSDSIQVYNDEVDDSGKKLSSYYAYYDVMYSCWREMINYTDVKQVPLCEYMTVYNFIDFVENV